MRIVLAVIATLTLVACGQRDEAAYPPHYELNFRNSCQAQGASAAFCGCVWTRIVADVPASEFEAYERTPFDQKPNHPLTAQITGYAEACRASVPAPAEPAPAP